MHPLDILLVLLLAPAALAAPTRARGPAAWWRWLARAAVVCVALQAVVGLPRWQFGAAYAVAAWLFISLWRARADRPRRTAQRRAITWLRTVCLAGLFAITLVLALGFPVFTPPTPDAVRPRC